MNFIEEKFYPNMTHDGCLGEVATQLFEDYDFGNIEVVDSDAAEITYRRESPVSSVSIRFHAKPKMEGEEAEAMLFRVEFLQRGVVAGVYSAGRKGSF
jgi:hypothetical protein